MTETIPTIHPPVSHAYIEWYARRYAESNMIAMVTIVRMQGGPVMDEENLTEARIMRVLPLYIGKARVYNMSGPAGGDSTDESAAWSTSNISVPLYKEDGGPVVTQVNDLIRVDVHSDPLLENRVYRVMDVDSGGQWPVVRRHMVTGAQRYEGWTWIYVEPR